MTFEVKEASRTKGQKVSLLQIYYVNGEQYLYTDHEQPISLEGFAAPFLPVPIQHGAISAAGTLDKATLEIRMPRTSRVADAYRIYPPDEVVNIIIRQMHLSDPDAEALVVWTGRILGCSLEKGDMAVFSCEPVSTSMKRTGLRRHYQLGCPHALYGPQCAANKALATTPDIPVALIGGASVSVAPGWLPSGWSAAGKTPDKFIGGLAEWTYSPGGALVMIRRTILQVTNGITFTLNGPPVGLKVGSAIRFVLGCNHQMSDCKTVHNNIRNYGGQPFIPTKNPFGFSNNYY